MNIAQYTLAALFVLLFTGSSMAQSLASRAGHNSSLGERELAEPLLASVRLSTMSSKDGTTVISGQVMSPYGPLAGVYIKLLDYPVSVVANAEGEFAITVPADADKVRAQVSYAGFPDELVVLPVHQKYLTVEPWEGSELKALGVRFKNNQLKQGASSVN